MSGLFGNRSATTSSEVQAATGMRVQTSLYGVPIALAWGTLRAPVNLLWYGDFVATAQYSSAGGKGGGGGGSQVSGYSYTTGIAMAICEGPIASVLRVWKGKEQSTPANLGLTTFDGGAAQAPWGYLITYHPDEALVYPGLAYVASGSYALGDSPDMSNHTLEVRALYGAANAPDANPADVLVDFLTNARYGVPGFTAAMLAGVTEYRAYCAAQGLLVSPLWSEQKTAADYVTGLLKITNTDAVPTQGVLRLIPRTSAALVFAVGADELLAPVKRSSAAEGQANDDGYNVVRLEVLDRSRDYNVDTAVAQDAASIAAYGRREASTVTAHEICDLSVAQRAAQLLLQRGLWTRQRYTLKLGVQRALVEPGDVGTIPYRGQTTPVRVIEVTRDGEELSWLCEEYVDDGGDATGITASGGAGYGADYGATPGPTVAPVFVDAPSWLTGGAAQIWMAVTGSGNWGGVRIWASLDGTTYRRIGSTKLKGRYGTLRSAFGAPAADPDTVNTLAVQLTDTTLTIDGSTDADAQANQTLCLVGGTELVCYVNSALVGAGQYNLTRLYRGRKSTVTASHASGASFLRIDGAVFRYTYDKSLIGKTLHIKLTAFNQYGGGEEDLSAATVYTITPTPLPPPVGATPDYVVFGNQQDGGGE